MRLLPTRLLAACASAQAQTDPFAPLAWLAGCWAQQGREAGSVEQWMARIEGEMNGKARGIAAALSAPRPPRWPETVARGLPVLRQAVALVRVGRGPLPYRRLN